MIQKKSFEKCEKYHKSRLTFVIFWYIIYIYRGDENVQKKNRRPNKMERIQKQKTIKGILILKELYKD